MTWTWQACLDESTGEYYYWNEDTGEVTWDVPAEFEDKGQVCVHPQNAGPIRAKSWPQPMAKEGAGLEGLCPRAAMPLVAVESDPVNSIPLVPLAVATAKEAVRSVATPTATTSTEDVALSAPITDYVDDEWACPLDRDNENKARLKDHTNSKTLETVQRWIEAVLDQDLGLELGPAIQDGQVLCMFLNKIRPGTVKKIHEVQPEEDGAFVSAANIFKAQENVSSFTKGCIKLGVPRSSIFDTLDVLEVRDLNAFLHCATMLGRIVQTFKDYDGPQLLTRSEQIESMKLSFQFGPSKNVPTMFRRGQTNTPPLA